MTGSGGSGRAVNHVRRPSLPYQELHFVAMTLIGSWDRLTDRERRGLVERIVELMPQVVHSVASVAEEPTVGDIDGRRQFSARLAALTPRERQVLARLADVESTADVARDLGVTTDTVRTHIKRMLPKLGVHSRVEAVALYLNAT